MEKIFSPTEIQARREFARTALINKQPYHPQLIKFYPRWQANNEAKQGRFQLDLYRPLAFQRGDLLYNQRDHNWIPNAKIKPGLSALDKTQNTRITSCIH